MTRWPLWRLLVWVEAWLMLVAAFHRSRPIHEDFVVPLLFGVVPGIVIVAFWGLARAAAGHSPAPNQRASWLEVALTVVASLGTVFWVGEWTGEVRADVRRLEEMVGQATIIIDISLTGLSAAACIAALALDWVLSTAHEQLRATMTWLRRTHLLVTGVYVVALFGSAWVFTHWPDPSGPDAALLDRARFALDVYQFAKGTAFPVQALFAALALWVVTVDSRQ
jgi:hypothetical protein